MIAARSKREGRTARGTIVDFCSETNYRSETSRGKTERQSVSERKSEMLPMQMRMARAALDWTVRDLAEKAGLSHDTVVRMEAGEAVKASTLQKALVALEAAGVIFVQENGDGPGVRLRKGIDTT